MPKKGERKCPSCKDFGYPDGGRDSRGDYHPEWRWAERTNREICCGCYESDEEHASTIVRFTREGRAVVRVGDDILYDPETGEVPDWFEDVFESRGYVRTDGWRGYYDTKLKGSYVKLGSGWVTGWPDDTVAHKQVACDLDEFLEKRDGWKTLPAGVALYWVFDPTSNVFSMASDLLVPEEQAPLVKHWLEEFGFSPAAVEDAFD